MAETRLSATASRFLHMHGLRPVPLGEYAAAAAHIYRIHTYSVLRVVRYTVQYIARYIGMCIYTCR